MKVEYAEKHPYYIYAPSYSRTSAGVRSLYVLCDALNRHGYPSYIWSGGAYEPGYCPVDFLAPQVTRDVLDAHYGQGRTPIVFYPEVVSGNPLGAECVVRFLGNFPGLLGGDTTFPPNEMVFGYTDTLCAAVPDASGRLFIPVIDTDVFRLSERPRDRRGACFYAAKFRSAGFTPFGLPEGAIEIHRDPGKAQSREELVELFQTCEVMYAFEDTSLILEAALCGCPVVFMKSEFFETPLGIAQFGSAGMALSHEGLGEAKITVANAGAAYNDLCSRAESDLDHFIKITQARAASMPYSNPIRPDSVFSRLWRRPLEIDGRIVHVWCKSEIGAGRRSGTERSVEAMFDRKRRTGRYGFASMLSSVSVKLLCLRKINTAGRPKKVYLTIADAVSAANRPGLLRLLCQVRIKIIPR